MSCFKIAARGDVMAEQKNILIVGDGAAGIMTSNKLRMMNRLKDAKITLIGSKTTNFCRSDGPQISLGMKKHTGSVKPIRFLLNPGIDFARDQVTTVEPSNRCINTLNGGRYDYDYLVLAPGLEPSVELLPGYEGEAKQFLDLQHSMELSKILERFTKGNIMVAINKIPTPNLVGFYEFAILLSEQIAGKEGGDSKVTFVYPEEGTFPVKVLSDFFERKFKKFGINLVSKFKIASVNQKNHEIVSSKDERMNYDVLVIPKPYRNRKFMLSDELLGNKPKQNLKTSTLTVKDYDDVYVAGDALDSEISELSGSFVTQSRFIAERIASDINGLSFSKKYDGTVSLTAMTGEKLGMTISYSYEKSPNEPRESSSDYIFKKYYSDFYFSSLLRGLM